MTFAAIAGVLLILAILWEAFETVVLPRRVSRHLRLTVLFYRMLWRSWRFVARRIRRPSRRETFLSFFGPLSLLLLFAFWAAGIVFGFAILYYVASYNHPAHPSFWSRVYLSGTTMSTLGIGDVVPHTPIERAIVVAESGLGLGFLALVLSYLPVIYQAFSRREVNIVLLDARAGSPPTAAELLRRHTGADGAEELEQLLRNWERAAAEILESHISYPAVAYFRSQHNNESWLAALAALLDTTALLLASIETTKVRQARLTFAICRHTVVDLAQLFNTPPRRSSIDRLPPLECDRLRTVLAAAGFRFRTDVSSTKFRELREMYEPYLQALSEFLYMPLPPWILAKEITDNWKTTAWGRITGFSAGQQLPDDHAD
jgi:hypothetical protein